MAESTELKVVVSMVDEISGKLRATQDKMQDFSDGARKVGTVFTAVGAGIVGALGGAVLAAADAEKSQKQLEHATLNVAHGSQQQLEALEATSAALQKKGVLDGDNIKMGQAQLMTFGLSADMVNKLSGSMADLAVNQFGVDATGEDMTQTANMMAKALNGQFGVLEKSGIRFTEAQQHMIQFGTETERAAALQEGFAQNLKFTNEVAAQTLEGQIAKLKVTMGDLTEQIGGALMPVVTDLVVKVQPVIQKVMDWISQNEKLAGKIALVAAGIGAFLVIAGPLLIMLSFLPALIAGVGIALAVVTSPIFLVGVAVAALILGFVLLVKNWDWVKGKAKEFVDYITGIISGWANTLGDKFNLVKNSARSAFENVTGTVRFWIGEALNAVNWAIDAIKNKIFEIPNALGDAFSQGVNRAKGFISSIDIPGIPGFATGVQNFGGGLAVVGEKGPELVNLPRGSDVIPMSSGGGMQSAGGTTINIVVNGDVSGEKLVEKVGDQLVRRLQLSTAIV